MKLIQTTLSIIILTGMLNFPAQSQSASNDYPIRPVPFTLVKVTDNFWAPRIKLNHEVTIPIALKQCYITGRVDNFKVAGGLQEGKFCTQYPFDDTDIYKIIEGASYSLQTTPDPNLEARLDTLIGYVGKAQEPDGYLYTSRTIDPAHPHKWSGTERWEMESDLSHELYNSGHLFEAAVAHFQATGKRSFLEIAIKNADLLVKTFGPGKLMRSPGHQVVEMGLVKMYRVTGQKEYLDLAGFFIDSRGQNSPHARGEYSQDHIPVIEQTEAVGHAVRATYLYSGMADVAAITGNQAYVNALGKIWDDLINYKLYITGGIGAQAGHEGFGPKYDLPNMSAYNETCASIGEIYWNYRLFLLHGDSKYFDVLEQILYNGMISGVSQIGDRFFYPNPLESKGQHKRSEWFGCACCPSNVCRFIPSVPGYIYGQTDSRLYVNLFVQSKANVTMSGEKLEIEQTTKYPWEGEVKFSINPEKAKSFELALRIPAWLSDKPLPGNLYRFSDSPETKFLLKLNGKPAKYKLENGFAVISNQWKKGDVVTLSLPMEIRRVVANEKLVADNNKVALMRGPIVYCAEWPDYQDKHVLNLVLENNVPLKSEYHPEMLGGVVLLKGEAKKFENRTKVNFTAIPYYSWANRGAGEMQVWIDNKGK
ncbi:MAG: glycoside hydrolase family 127 protein [Bacteroidota bacterium]|nr:six-hairpin glycosidase [Odoribacter sp.]MDP3644835.1 glycoside hydrolase family 127 protein [Bacteroidota bacterium]